MIKLAIRDFPYFKFSDIELKREGTTYTVDTLRELTKQDTDCRYYFIMEQIRFIRSRHGRSRTDFTMADILVATRNDSRKCSGCSD